jgi:hypothetical protein
MDARHPGVAQSAAIFKTKQVSVEALALLEIVDRDRPVGHAVDLEHVPHLLTANRSPPDYTAWRAVLTSLATRHMI